MRKNVGTADAIFRITVGLAGLAWSTSHMTRHPNNPVTPFAAMLSSMMVAEGITRFCPFLALMGINTRKNRITRRDRKSEFVAIAGPIRY